MSWTYNTTNRKYDKIKTGKLSQNKYRLGLWYKETNENNDNDDSKTQQQPWWTHSSESKCILKYISETHLFLSWKLK